jgi:STE24 endopeptidase
MPIEAAFSRRMEKEADDFAAELIKSPEPMILSLKRLASDNLSNLTPHPIYVWFYYSHPPLGERIARLSKKRNLP